MIKCACVCVCWIQCGLSFVLIVYSNFWAESSSIDVKCSQTKFIYHFHGHLSRINNRSSHLKSGKFTQSLNLLDFVPSDRVFIIHQTSCVWLFFRWPRYCNWWLVAVFTIASPLLHFYSTHKHSHAELPFFISIALFDSRLVMIITKFVFA